MGRRHEIASFYDAQLKDLGIQLPKQSNFNYSSYHLYPIRVSKRKGGLKQKNLYCELLSNNIGVNLHYIPIYRHPFFRKKGFQKGYCNEAEEHFKEVISLPIHQSLNNNDLEFIIRTIHNCFKNN